MKQLTQKQEERFIYIKVMIRSSKPIQSQTLIMSIEVQAQRIQLIFQQNSKYLLLIILK